MGDVAYRSKVRIERVKGPLRRAFLPAEEEHTNSVFIRRWPSITE